jgi:ABC-type branched-subunit amino acid transport system substrate-binding protein
MTSRASAVAHILLLGSVLLVGLAVSPPAGHAQVRDTIPRNSDAELMFEQGVSAFERGDYQTAAERLRLVGDYPLNRTTTAALVMQGKALLRLGRYQEAVDVLDTLLDRYPETSYAEEARRVLNVARTRLEQSGTRPDTLRVGVALPTTDEFVALSQALFNGIRLAVDEHNGLRRRYVPPPGLQARPDSFDVANTAEAYSDSLAEAEGRTTVTTATDTVRVDSLQIVTEQAGRPDWIAKMHFRQTRGTPDGARSAVDSLLRRDEVDVVLGPLFSRTARAAGAVAEQARTLMVAPLATDESVSAGREYVFQTNPTIRLRGRIMARFVAEGLLTESASIIYEKGIADSERMAEGFRAEAEAQDVRVPFTLRLDTPRDWSRLPEAIEADSTITDSMFAATEAFYLPIAGRNATGKIQDALTGLSRFNTTARVLGNSSWHNLTVKKEASRFTATYANDFHVETKRPEAQRFVRRYRLLTGRTPGQLSTPEERRLAYTGYDVARFLLRALAPTDLRLRPADLRSASLYEGLGMRIDFEDGNVNQAMFFHRYRNNRIERLR